MSNLSELLPSGAGQNQVEFVASGTLPNGKPVILKADGTIQVVGIGDSPVSQNIPAATEVQFVAGSAQYLTTDFDPNTPGRFVTVFRDPQYGGYGRVVVGQVSGTSITFGAMTEYNTSGTNEFSSVAFDPNIAGKFVIAFLNDTHGVVMTGHINAANDYFSWGNIQIFDSSAASMHRVAFDPNTANRIVVVYSDSSGEGNHGKAIVGTISGDTISYGTPVKFNTAATYVKSISFDPNTANTFVVAFPDGGSQDKGTAVVGIISGTNVISFGSKYVFSSGCSVPHVVYNPNTAGKFVVAYSAVNNSGYGSARVGTVTGNTISYGSEVVFNSANSAYVALASDPNTADKFVVAYRDYGNSNYGTINVGTMSGTSISFGSKIVMNSGRSDFNAVAFDYSNINAGKFVVVWRDTSTTCDARLGQIAATAQATNLTSTNLVGISAAAAADAATAKINTWGGINSTVTPAAGALTTYAVTVGNYGGNKYYIDGALTPTLNLIKGNTYKFDQSNSTNSGHPFVFSIAGGSGYSTGVTIVGTPGNAGAYTQIVVAADAPILYYKCSVHSGMGGQANTTAASLTIASDYYVQNDGTITTASTSPAQKIGTAISSTTINIKDLT